MSLAQLELLLFWEGAQWLLPLLHVVSVLGCAVHFDAPAADTYYFDAAVDVAVIGAADAGAGAGAGAGASADADSGAGAGAGVDQRGVVCLSETCSSFQFESWNYLMEFCCARMAVNPESAVACSVVVDALTAVHCCQDRRHCSGVSTATEKFPCRRD